MLSILCVRLTIQVKVGIPESIKVGWYPPKKTGSSHLKVPKIDFTVRTTNKGGSTNTLLICMFSSFYLLSYFLCLLSASLASEKTGPINPWERFNMGESSFGNETVRRRQRPFEALTSASDNLVTHISGWKKQCSRTGS